MLLFSIFSVLICIAIIFLGIVIFHNRYGEKTSAVMLSSVLVPLLAAVALISKDLLAPLEQRKIIIPVGVVSAGVNEIPQVTRLIGLGSLYDPLSGYSRMEDISFRYQKYAATLDAKRVEALRPKFQKNILEVSVYQTLQSHFPVHWQMEYLKFSGISGASGSGGMKDGAHAGFKQYGLVDLNVIFSENEIWQMPNESVAVNLWPVTFPPESIVTRSPTPLGSLIVVDTPNLTLEIELRESGGSNVLDDTKLATIIRKQFPDRQSSLGHHFLIVSWKEKRLRRWSPLTEAEKKWANEVCELLVREFDWEALKRHVSNR